MTWQKAASVAPLSARNSDNRMNASRTVQEQKEQAQAFLRGVQRADCAASE